MTALTARRTNFKETGKRSVSPETIINRTVTAQQHHSRQRIINETYPELSLDQEKKDKVRLRYKTPSLPATIEDASEDEEVSNFFFKLKKKLTNNFSHKIYKLNLKENLFSFTVNNYEQLFVIHCRKH